MAIKTLPSCGYSCYSKALPAAFDESISYLEMLAANNSKQNEIIVQVNKNTEFIENWSGDLEELKQRMTAVEEYVDEEVEAIRSETDAKIAAEESRLNAKISTDVAAAEQRIQANVTSEVTRLDNRIDNIALGQIRIIDPTTGLLSDLQTVINNIATTNREDALTATEYDALELTATAFDAENISAYDYDFHGKSLLSE